MATPNANTIMRAQLADLRAVDSKYCPLTTRIMKAFLDWRMVKTRKPASVKDTVMRAALQTGSSIEGAAVCRWLRDQNINLEVDIMYAVGTISKDNQDAILEAIPSSPGFYRLRYIDGIEHDLEPAFVEMLVDRGHTLKSSSSSEYIDAMALKRLAVQEVRFKDDDDSTRTLGLELFGYNVLKVTSDTTVEGPSACVVICLDVFGLPKAELSIDNVVCLKLENWPTIAMAWVKRKTRQWPDDGIISSIVSRGCHIVPKATSRPPQDGASSQDGHPHEWRLSFSEAERYLASLRTDPQHECYFILKSIFYTHLKNLKEGEQSVPSYVLKTTMMWAMEESQPDSWKPDNTLMEKLGYLLGKLEQSFRQRHLEHYFIQDINILEGFPESLLTKAADLTHSIRQDPLKYLPENLAEITSLGNKVIDTLTGVVTFLELRTLLGQ